MTLRIAAVVALIAAGASCGGRPAPEGAQEPVAEEEQVPGEVEVEAPVHLDEASKALQVAGKGGLVVVESGFRSFEGDRCVITLDAHGNLITSVSLPSGFKCPFEEGKWKVEPGKVQELVQMINAGAQVEPAGPAGKGLDSGTKIQTGQGTYEVVPGGKVDPVEEYLLQLYEAR